MITIRYYRLVCPSNQFVSMNFINNRVTRETKVLTFNERYCHNRLHPQVTPQKVSKSISSHINFPKVHCTLQMRRSDHTYYMY